MWTIPGLYGLLLALRLLPAEQPLPRWTGVLPILAQLVAWGWLLVSSQHPASLIGNSLTMSWGLFGLVVALGSWQLDPKEEHPELFNTGLLLATLLSVLWVSSLGAQLPTRSSLWEIIALWLADFGGGCLFLLAMLGWHIAYNAPSHKARLIRWLTRLQIVAVLCFLAALLCALPEPSGISLTQRGYVLFLLFAVGGLWMPALPSGTAPGFSRPTLQWLFTGAVFTASWAFVRLFALV